MQRRFINSNENIPVSGIVVAAGHDYAGGILQPQFLNMSTSDAQLFSDVKQYMAISARILDVTVYVHPITNPTGDCIPIDLIAGDRPYAIAFDYIREDGSAVIANLRDNLIVYPF